MGEGERFKGLTWGVPGTGMVEFECPREMGTTEEESGLMTEQQQPDLVPGMHAVAAEPVSDESWSALPPHFDVLLRGYDRRQVDEYVAGQAGDLARLREQFERGRPSFDALGRRVAQILELAEAEADEMRSQAGAEATRVREQAVVEAEQLGAAARRELAELHAQRAEVLAELAAIRGTIGTALDGATDVWPSGAPAEVPAGIVSPTQDTIRVDLTQHTPQVSPPS